MQSSFNQQQGIHVAIIMDGNGRWATHKGWPRVAGHRAGAKVARRIIEAAPDAGINTLTLYAFSSDNWKRPSHEVAALMKLFSDYLRSETARCITNGVRLSIIGRRDRFSPQLTAIINNSEEATRHGKRLHLRIALDYSARDAILHAAAQLQAHPGALDRENFSAILNSSSYGAPAPDVDLLIRTGGEQRLSDFLLWESAYAELAFVPQMWPDFTERDLQKAVYDFHGRDRRFGGVNDVPQAAAV